MDRVAINEKSSAISFVEVRWNGIMMKELDRQNIEDVNQENEVFTIDSRLHIQIKENRIIYSRENVSPYEKRYNIDERDLKSYISNPDRAIYLIYVDHYGVGQIIIRKHWHKYVYNEDVVVDIAYRKQGIGTLLLEQAKG